MLTSILYPDAFQGAISQRKYATPSHPVASQPKSDVAWRKLTERSYELDHMPYSPAVA